MQETHRRLDNRHQRWFETKRDEVGGGGRWWWWGWWQRSLCVIDSCFFFCVLLSFGGRLEVWELRVCFFFENLITGRLRRVYSSVLFLLGGVEWGWGGSQAHHPLSVVVDSARRPQWCLQCDNCLSKYSSNFFFVVCCIERFVFVFAFLFFCAIFYIFLVGLTFLAFFFKSFSPPTPPHPTPCRSKKKNTQITPPSEHCFSHPF